jgi:hypothetical protein
MVFSQAQVECCAWEERSRSGAVFAGLEGVSQFECYVIQDSQSIATLHLGGQVFRYDRGMALP